MKIIDLVPGMGHVSVDAEVTKKDLPRDFVKFGRPGRVCYAEISDDTGTARLTLWNEQVDAVQEGDQVSIENGYTSEYKGELQVSVGRMGSISVQKR